MPSIYKKTTPPLSGNRNRFVRVPLHFHAASFASDNPFYPTGAPCPCPPTTLPIPADESGNHESIPLQTPSSQRECVSDCAYGRLRFHLSCLESRVDRESCKMARRKTNITGDHRTKDAIYFAGFCVATAAKRFRPLRDIHGFRIGYNMWLKLRHCQRSHGDLIFF